MTWFALYLAVGVVNCLQFTMRAHFSSFVELLFFLLLWPLQLLFAIFAYIVLPVVNWIGERVLP